ncbi:hypothetical protein Bca101_042014 [Brassica carinata]
MLPIHPIVGVSPYIKRPSCLPPLRFTVRHFPTPLQGWFMFTLSRFDVTLQSALQAFSNLDLVSRDHGSLLGLANTNTHLTDVIGELIAVKSIVSDVHQGKEPVMATIKLDNGVSVSLCLFETVVLEFHFRNTYFFKWSNLQNSPAATAKVAKTARVA